MNILIVDDEKINRLLLRITIINNIDQVEIYEVSNGLESLEILNKTNIDLVFMDLSMPVMDGVEAIYRIRENISKTVPIYIVSAHLLDYFEKKIDEKLYNGYLSKPINLKQLSSIIKNHMNDK